MLYKKIPSNQLLLHELGKRDIYRNYTISREGIKILVNQEVDQIRNHYQDNGLDRVETDYLINQIIENVLKRLDAREMKRKKRVINATGVILHTNLGRARLSERAINHVTEIMKNYSNLEYDIAKTERGKREEYLESLLVELTGHESAMVVNNNASAIFLILSVFSKNKEVIISRGEVIEIGGGFRISSIMEESGAILREVGTTNRTYIEDYKNLINDKTSMLLKVHKSNFETTGFVKETQVKELMKLSREFQEIIVYEDLGSGLLIDLNNNIDLRIKKSLCEADIISFSGDKLLGGPQAGIIAGKATFIEKLKKSQLSRVLRADKMTIAALESTLESYIKQDYFEIPTIRDMYLTVQDIERKIESFISKSKLSLSKWEWKIADGYSVVGGGALPDLSLPTKTLLIRNKYINSKKLKYILANATIPVIVKISSDYVIFDMRTVSDEEIDVLIGIFNDLHIEG